MDKSEYYDIHSRYYFNDPGTQDNIPDNYDGSENEIDYVNFPHKWLYFGIFMLFYVSVCYKRSGFGRNTDLNERLVENENNMNIKKTIEKIKKNKISSDDITDSDKTCSICLEEFSQEKEIIILDCKHIYHNDCIIEWIYKDTSCPLCRSSSLV